MKAKLVDKAARGPKPVAPPPKPGKRCPRCHCKAPKAGGKCALCNPTGVTYQGIPVHDVWPMNTEAP